MFLAMYGTFHENSPGAKTLKTLLRKWEQIHENYPCMKGLANNFVKFSPRKNNHVYSSVAVYRDSVNYKINWHALSQMLLIIAYSVHVQTSLVYPSVIKSHFNDILVCQ